MRTRDARARGVALGLALALSTSCASNPTPSGGAVTQEEAISSGKGAYALVRYFDGSTDAGELIVANDAQLLLLTNVRAPHRRSTGAHVAELTLGVHGNRADALAGWDRPRLALDDLATASSSSSRCPLWLGTGIGATAKESHRGLFHCPADTPRDGPDRVATPVPAVRRRVRAVSAGAAAGGRARAAPRARAGCRAGALEGAPAPAIAQDGGAVRHRRRTINPTDLHLSRGTRAEVGTGGAG